MNLRSIALAAAAAGVVVSIWAVAQVPTTPRPLAQWTPSGAVLYLESADFATQLRDWNRSGVKAKWLTSKNDEEFMTTRLMLKLREVYADFSNAAGFEPNLTALETVAGTDTAVAVYDVRRLDLVYISHLPAARLGENVLTRVRSGYQTRSAGGQSYYVRQAAGRTAAFAIAGEYLIASTREDLLTATLELIQGGSTRASVSQEKWYEDAVRALPANAGPADMRLVVDLATAIKLPYFRSYWIQKNTDDLRKYYSFISQVSRRADAIEETRLLLRLDEAPVVSHDAAARDLARYISDDVGLARLWDAATSTFTMELIRQKFFAGPPPSAARRYAPQLSSGGPVGTVFDLQTRIDEAPKPSLAGSLDLSPLNALVESAGLEAVLHLESSLPSDGSTYVRSDAAIALRAASAWNADAVRSALTSAVASYQSVNNIGLQWRNVTSGGVTVSQLNGLLPMVMYADGPTLWIARSPALIASAVARAATAPAAGQSATYLARFNYRAELPPYLRLMRMLDLSDQTNYSALFSENIGSLGSSLDVIDSVSVIVQESPLSERQVVLYRLGR